ncbi:acyltransferase family protein [Arthrobacter sp. ISL-28]|uniref:acyltransferase family protein n=1 Tax=Arthrobacter sp. ISL-28 TaxID=2819108 RepID=UPI001BECBCBD|nr:acyltransferase family protein [Arthrobacter sp. ISL-28]MBT2522752.1 acyltransferase family protein [Arthrobacter sp. ISL-28]
MKPQTSLVLVRPGRSGALDFLRVLGIMAVVVGHIGAWSGPLIRESIYTWHVPLFFFLSGYLWTEGRGLIAEANKRARTLLIPYAVWLAVAGVWWLSQKQVVYGGDIRRLVLGGSYIGGTFAAFWFVTALFVAVVVVRAMQRLPLWVQWVLSLAALTTATIDSETVAKIPLSAGVGCACIVFVLAGREFKKVRFNIQRPLITGLLLLLGCSAVILAGWSTYLDMKQALFGIPAITVVIAIAICSALVLIAEAVIPALGARVNAAVSTLASCGFMVVLTHAVVLVELTKLNVPPWLVLVFCLVGTWIPALLILRTRLAPYLLGSPRRGPRTAQPHSSVDAPASSEMK